jgi:hypothetical protein
MTMIDCTKELDEMDLIVDTRENPKTMPTTAVIPDLSGSWLACLVCKTKTQDQNEFIEHKCTIKGDQDLV